MTQFFKREDWTLFGNINTLGQKAGVPKDRILHLVAKELTDNALDTGANIQSGILGSYDGFFIQDDGEGIPGTDGQLAELFSINRPLISSKVIRKPSRGALGNGLRVVAGAMFSLDGKVRIHTRGRALEMKPGNNGQATFEQIGEYAEPGTRIEFYAAGIPADVLTWSDLAGAINHGKAYTGKTSLFWYDSDSFFALLQSAPTGVSIRKFLADNFDGCSGKKAGEITADFYNVEALQLDREQADQILAAGREIAGQVKHRRLGYVGQFDRDCLAYDRTESEITIKPGRGKFAAVLPVVIEVWAKQYGRPAIFVNRTPITGKYTIAIRDKYLYLDGCGLNYYYEKRTKYPAAIWINITAPYMPITSDGKAPDFSQISSLIGKSFLKVTKAANRKHKATAPAKRSMKDVVKSVLWGEVEKLSLGFKLPYRLRNLFYNIRPHVSKELEKEPDYNYFCSIITDIEDEKGADLPNIHREERGVFIHPFDGEETPLGTAAVERYQRPEYQFNKVLYIEKRGLFNILQHAKIPQRYDLALMSTAGFANRAARDLIDMIGETNEAVQFFCIHDADAAGTKIYDTLVNETKARGARTVEIIDLGLDPGEALEMGLQVEKVSRKRRNDVGENYLAWSSWLQTNRIELDAMPPEVFLQWIESKLQQYHAGKLVPPPDYLDDYAEDQLTEKLTEVIEEEVRKEYDLESIVKERLKERLPGKLQALDAGAIARQIRAKLEEQPERHWTAPAAEIISGLAST